jgi:hypothetical protein
MGVKIPNQSEYTMHAFGDMPLWGDMPKMRLWYDGDCTLLNVPDGNAPEDYMHPNSDGSYGPGSFDYSGMGHWRRVKVIQINDKSFIVGDDD